jgi:hypothetical protein
MMEAVQTSETWEPQIMLDIDHAHAFRRVLQVVKSALLRQVLLYVGQWKVLLASETLAAVNARK